jgi:hypothetical protein
VVTSEPITWLGGLLSTLPETTWWAGMVARAGRGELRSLLRVEAGYGVQLCAEQACAIAVVRCLRPEAIHEPTWHYCDRLRGERWKQPGGSSEDDGMPLITLDLRPRVVAMVGPFESATVLLLRREDRSETTVALAARAEERGDG